MLSTGIAMSAQAADDRPPAGLEERSAALETALVGQHGEAQRERARRGLRQVASFWRASDGDANAFEAFVREHFAADAVALDALFARFENHIEKIDGHFTELNRELRAPVDLDTGPLLPVDEAFAGYDPWAHLVDDFFGNKLAFAVLLNFPLTTLQERLEQGAGWSRRSWAETRLAERFAKRTPAEVKQGIAAAVAAADRYIAEYNIWMHHVLDEGGMRLFPPKLRLLSHWNLRDEIKAQYGAADAAQALQRQRVVQKVMERIVTQEIPAVAINNPAVDWNPFSNTVTPAAVQDAPEVKPLAGAPSAAREPDTRYAHLRASYRAHREADRYSPTAPTLIARRFEEDRQLPEARVRAMLEQVLAAPEVAEVARLIRERLGRPLEPFDLWYNGFKPKGTRPESELDALVRQRYPTAQAYQSDIPRLLRKLGFSDRRAKYLADNIVTEPARGSGHAMGAGMRWAKTRLRTRVEKEGMNYKGYNIAVHEMGHNVEQTFSLNNVDHVMLAGVPNNAFTEALAFVFQKRDLELLNLAAPSAEARALATLRDFWATFEIAGVALVDIGIWHWMYEHPEASAAEVREATVKIAREVWNRWYAPHLGQKDVVLLGIYSHMIHYALYLPDYPIGHMIAFQIEQQMEKAGNVGREFERMATTGRVTPDQWMIKATGRPVGPEALLEATRRALVDLAAPAAKPAPARKTKAAR